MSVLITGIVREIFGCDGPIYAAAIRYDQTRRRGDYEKFANALMTAPREMQRRFWDNFDRLAEGRATASVGEDDPQS